jgi:two-component system sensor kinase FixL
MVRYQPMSAAHHPSTELQALLDAAVDAVIFIDDRGTIRIFNRSAERMFGYPGAEALGQNVTLLMDERDRSEHDAHLERYFRTGVPHIIGLGREVQARRKDGSLFPALLSVGEVAGADPPQLIGFVQDLTLRRQSLAALDRERQRATRYLEATQTMLIGIDLKQRVTMVNRKGCEVLERTEAELVGANWFERVIPEHHRAAAGFAFQALLERQPHQAHYFECPILTQCGTERLIAWRAMVVDDARGRVTEVLWSGDDVTESHLAEQELREARQRMTQVSRLATLGEMASGIAHELNQPLAAIANFAQAGTRLLSPPRPDLQDIREALTQIAEQALRAGDIVNRLRSLARHRSLKLEIGELNEAIREIEPLTHADVRASGVRLSLELDPQLPRVELDRIQVQHLLLNLLRNSIDALQSAPTGQREITIRTTGQDDGQVQLSVADNGPGVSESIRERLFMPFATTKEHGTGLGLVISRAIVEAHRGRLDYETNRPHGARFVIRLPSAVDANSSAQT